MHALPRIALSSGEPSGIGPDLCLEIATRNLPCQLVVLGSRSLLAERAHMLGLDVALQAYHPLAPRHPQQAGSLILCDCALAVPSRPGRPDPANAQAVLDLIRRGAEGCLEGEFDALVTAPVHKGVINDAGIPFTGHTEFLAAITGGVPVMLLAAPGLRVALATTHLPLRQVADAISMQGLLDVLGTLHRDLIRRFGIPRPRILVAGLNPHAGEGGHLGREEIEIITPALERLRGAGMDLRGPLPADTLFTPPMLAEADAVLAMYHDQGLPVLKHLGFGRAVNITLGLPILRTSVDHGTALELAGTGRADVGSLVAAIETAIELSRRDPRQKSA